MNVDRRGYGLEIYNRSLAGTSWQIAAGVCRDTTRPDTRNAKALRQIVFELRGCHAVHVTFVERVL